MTPRSAPRALAGALLVLVAGPAVAQGSFASAASGPWWTPSTWTLTAGADADGVPDADDAVQILPGHVVSADDRTAAHLTVEAGGELEAEYGATRTLTITGDVVNRGTIRNQTPHNYALVLRVGGDATNTGTWTPHETRFVGLEAQQIGGTAPYGGPVVADEVPGSPLVAATPLTFATSLRLGGATLVAGAQTVTFAAGELWGQGGTVDFDGGVLRLASTPGGDAGTKLHQITVDGPFSLRGQADVDADVTFRGDVTVGPDGVLAAYYGATRTLTVDGALTNRGTVRNQLPHNYALVVRLTDALSQRGTWTPHETRLVGSTAQTVTATAPLGGGVVVDDDAGSPIVAGSDLTFATTLALQGATLQASTRTVRFTAGELQAWNPSGANGTVDFSGGTLHLAASSDGSSGTKLYSVTVDGPFTLRGQADVDAGVQFIGDVTVASGATLTAYYGATRTLSVTGALTNQGTVRNQLPHGYALVVRLGGHLTNDGPWTPHETRFVGATAQTITATAPLGGGVVIDDGRSSPLVAGSDLAFGTHLVLQGATLQAGARTVTVGAVNVDGPAPVEAPNGVLDFEGGALRLASTENGHAGTKLYGLTIDGPVTLHGQADVDTGVLFRNGVTVAADGVLAAYYGATRTLAVEGPLVNHGVLRNQVPHGYELHLALAGDATSDGTWTAGQTTILGTGRTLTLGPEAAFAGERFVVPAEASAVAGSDLRVTRWLQVAGTLAMGARRLTVGLDGTGGSIDGFGTGVVRFAGGTLEARGDGKHYAVGFEGDLTLTGTHNIDSGVTITGTATVDEHGVLAGYYGATRVLSVAGTLVNRGLLRNQEPHGYHLHVAVDGSFRAEAGTVRVGALSMTGPLVSPAAADSLSRPVFLNVGEIRTGGLDVDGAAFDNSWVTSTGGPLARFERVSFANVPNDRVQLRIEHPGPGAPFVVREVAFDPLYYYGYPSYDHGLYVYAHDTAQSDGSALRVEVRESTRGNGLLDWVHYTDPQNSSTQILGWFYGGDSMPYAHVAGGGWSNWIMTTVAPLATSGTYAWGTPGERSYLALEARVTSPGSLPVEYDSKKTCDCQGGYSSGGGLAATGWTDAAQADDDALFDLWDVAVGAWRFLTGSAGTEAAVKPTVTRPAPKPAPVASRPAPQPMIGYQNAAGACKSGGLGRLIAAGGGNLIAAGGGNLIAAGGGNLQGGPVLTLQSEAEGLEAFAGDDGWVDLFVAYVDAVSVEARVVLEGAADPAYDGGPASRPMRAALHAGGLLPDAQPYGPAYAGTDLAYGIEVVFPEGYLEAFPDIVDWVMVELRDPVADSVVAKRVALLLRDGRVVDLDGQSAVGFVGLSGPEFVVAVRHRNHLPLVSAGPVSFLNDTATGTVDFTLPGAAAGTAAVEVAAGVWAAGSGDLDHDGDVDANDEAAWRARNGSAGYLDADPGLDGAATAEDLQERVRPNAGLAGPTLR